MELDNGFLQNTYSTDHFEIGFIGNIFSTNK